MDTVTLTCTGCGATYPHDRLRLRCARCGEPLDTPVIRGTITVGDPLSGSALARYRDFYPYLDLSRDVRLGEGFTPLIAADALAGKIGIGGLCFKNESANPTWSFKDRGTATGVIEALGFGYKRIGTVSTGNMAVSVAAYGAAAGLDTVVLVNSDLPDEKLNPIAIYGPHLIKVAGDYSRMYDVSLEIGEALGIAFINSDATMRVAGYKTMAYEICEQCGFDVPSHVIVPTSAGGQIRGIWQGFLDFYQSGYIDRLPKMVAAQAAGCAPIATAHSGGSESITRFENPHTVAHAIENPFPPSGNAVLKMLKASGGFAVTATDTEILSAQKRLSAMGLFGQPASALPLAAVAKLAQTGQVGAGDRVVCVLTGSGLKYTAALEMQGLGAHSCPLHDLYDTVKNLL